MAAESIGIYIDGPNLYASQRRFQRNYRIDIVRLVERLARGRKVMVSHYFGAAKGPSLETQTRFHRFLASHGFQTHIAIQAGKGREKEVDVELALTVLEEAFQRVCDTAVLVSGDGDFAPLVRRLRTYGMAIEVAAFSHSLSPRLGEAGAAITFLDTIADDVRLF